MGWRFARHRRVGDAGGHLDQHQRTDHHDREKGAAAILNSARQALAA
jgi:hypothetical protein